MENTDKYSCTSNTVKLLKHLNKLSQIQRGRISPIMVHMIPTHKCQLNCIHCCFRNRKDKLADMDWDVWVNGIRQFIKLGVKAYEFTGGGDPLLWPMINDAIVFLWTNYCHTGLITNGLGLDKLRHPDHLDWVRISLNTLDYVTEEGREKLEQDIEKLTKKTSVSFCYIWNAFADKKFGEVVKFSNKFKIVCRVAPDCIQPLDGIKDQLSHIDSVLKDFSDNNYAFLSDFNVKTDRKNNHCFIHMIKPCFYLDGWVYGCPSAELALENNKQVQDKIRICKHDEILKFYTSEKARQSNEFDCSYCKYVQQQELLENLLTPTEFNDFA